MNPVELELAIMRLTDGQRLQLLLDLVETPAADELEIRLRA